MNPGAAFRAATALFIPAYVLIVFEKIGKTIVALTGTPLVIESVTLSMSCERPRDYVFPF